MATARLSSSWSMPAGASPDTRGAHISTTFSYSSALKYAVIRSTSSQYSFLFENLTLLAASSFASRSLTVTFPGAMADTGGTCGPLHASG